MFFFARNLDEEMHVNVFPELLEFLQPFYITMGTFFAFVRHSSSWLMIFSGI